jgi:hypothetical protein
MSAVYRDFKTNQLAAVTKFLVPHSQKKRKKSLVPCSKSKPTVVYRTGPVPRPKFIV